MIRIVVDAASDYEREDLLQKNIELVPIHIMLGDKSYEDGIDLNRNEFYKLLEANSEFPKTSQPSPQEFLDVFEDAKRAGDEVICILLSSQLSGTYQSAVIAKSMADYEPIYLIDSLSATYIIKVLADYACKLRTSGMSAPDIVEKVEELKGRVKVIAALDTLEYLARGGRLDKRVAQIGNMVNLKPIITVTKEGGIGIVGKCLGRSHAVRYIIRYLKELELDSAFPIYVIYSYGTHNCGHFQDKLLQSGIQADSRMQIGPTIGAHIGPEAFGVIFCEK